MTREEIEKAGIDYANNKPYTETVLNKNAFIAGAQWMADRLCIIPWDKALKELHDYWMEKEGENEN